MKIIIIHIVYALFITAGFSILFFYGYSSKTALSFMVLIGISGVIRFGIEGTFTKSNKLSLSKTSIFSFFTVIFALLAFMLAISSIDKKAYIAIMGNKPFLIAFWLCCMFAVASDFISNYKKMKNNSQQDE